MDVGTHVWIEHSRHIWTPATVIEVPTATQINVQLTDGTIQDITIEKGETIDTRIKLRNEEKGGLVDNLTALTHLHEPSILHAVDARYRQDEIYTQIGEILLAVNPFKKLKIYDQKHIQKYKEAPYPATDEASRLSPHVFNVARMAHANMVQEETSQSILVSGESGAGKTETCKIIMKFLANIAGRTMALRAQSSKNSKTTKLSIEERVLQSNPILEAFGNAKTSRNCNSSRFGKFVEIQFDSDFQIVGARIRTYLLEKIRLIKQSKGERNFHIFHELLAGASEEQRVKWNLDKATTYSHVSQKKSAKRKDGICDKAQFYNTLSAMKTVGMSESQIDQVLSIVAALLHLGNVAFENSKASDSGEKQARITEESLEHLDHAAELLQVTPESLRDSMISKTIIAGNETLQVHLSAEASKDARNALMMACYKGTFQWLVNRINAAIRNHDEMEYFIGLLDIFGFEDVGKNSFEQFCINYANESLQQQFNQYIFATEQSTYAAEQIRWNYIDFPNNVQCIELISARRGSMFSLLDQECLVPGGSDAGIASKYYKEFAKHPHFDAPPAFRQQNTFVVRHYAGSVRYNTKGFLNKNKDRLYDEAIDLLKTSRSSFVNRFAHDNAQSSGLASDSEEEESESESEDEEVEFSRLRKRCSSFATMTVATQFQNQLQDLTAIIQTTKPYYVRCIKPNDKNVSNHFDRARVVEQLRSGGVLEAVRVARAGYPVRLLHANFLEKYRSLSQRLQVKCVESRRNSVEFVDEIQEVMLRLLSVISDKTEVDRKQFQEEAFDAGVQIGKTNIFLKKEAYERLERWRHQTRHESALNIQRLYRGMVVRREIIKRAMAVIAIQSVCRCFLVKLFVAKLRQSRAITPIQSCVRGFLARKVYQQMQVALLTIQCAYRCYKARQLREELLKSKAAEIIRSRILGHYCRAQYLHKRKCIILIQCRARCKAAYHALKTLRAEAKSMKAMNEKQAQLENEIRMLRAQLLAKEAAPAPEESPAAKTVVAPAPEESPAANTVVAPAPEESPASKTAAAPTLQAAGPEDVPEASTSDPQPSSNNEACIKEELESSGNAEANNSKIDEAELPEEESNEADDSNNLSEKITEMKFKNEEKYQAGLKEKLRLSSGPLDMNLVQKLINSQSRSFSLRQLGKDAREQEQAQKAQRRTSNVQECTRTTRHDSFSSPRMVRCESLQVDSGFGKMRGTLSSTASSTNGGISRWTKDTHCHDCHFEFNFFIRRHHCRQCGNSFCHEHSSRKIALPQQGYPQPVRVCDDCFEALNYQNTLGSTDLEATLKPHCEDICL